MKQDSPNDDKGFVEDVTRTFFGALSTALARFLAAALVGGIVGAAVGYFIAGGPTALLGAGLGAAAAFMFTITISEL